MSLFGYDTEEERARAEEEEAKRKEEKHKKIEEAILLDHLFA